jgi:hypothetical protein
MKSTSKSRIKIHIPARVRHTVLLGVAALALSVFVGACMSLRNGRPAGPAAAERGLKFSHALHLEQGLDDCSMCHDTASDLPFHLSMPAHDLCSVCHEIDTEAEEPAGCDVCHLHEDGRVVPRASAFGEDIKFTHAPHIEAELACAQCHESPDEGALRLVPLKPFCMDCHGNTDPKLLECAVCHETTSQDTVPRFRQGVRIPHDAPALWERAHGHEARIAPEYCALCHDEQASCEDCHSRTAPKNHTIAWRSRTHGLQATWDRNSCAVCHEENFCIKCHQNATPSSHRGGWGHPLNRHCVNCHYPPERTNCTVCHERIDHGRAMPSPHTFGVYPANCAMCHPGGLPHRAPHMMNSTVSCVVCHR